MWCRTTRAPGQEERKGNAVLRMFMEGLLEAPGARELVARLWEPLKTL